MAQHCNPGTGLVEAGRSGVLKSSSLHGKLEASLGYRRPCVKKLNQNKEKAQQRCFGEIKGSFLEVPCAVVALRA